MSLRRERRIAISEEVANDSLLIEAMKIEEDESESYEGIELPQIKDASLINDFYKNDFYKNDYRSYNQSELVTIYNMMNYLESKRLKEFITFALYCNQRDFYDLLAPNTLDEKDYDSALELDVEYYNISIKEKYNEITKFILDKNKYNPLFIAKLV